MKKVKNDMVEKSFQNRQDDVKDELAGIFATQYISTLVSVCTKLSQSHPAFHRNALRTVVSICQQKRGSHNRLRLLLIWVVSWLSQLFALLMGRLIKN
jgi:hypothetical protein